MSNKVEKNKKNKETWRIWDALFSSSLFSVLIDSEVARKDDKKFRNLLGSWLFAIIFTVVLFFVLWWILN